MRILHNMSYEPRRMKLLEDIEDACYEWALDEGWAAAPPLPTHENDSSVDPSFASADMEGSFQKTIHAFLFGEAGSCAAAPFNHTQSEGNKHLCSKESRDEEKPASRVEQFLLHLQQESDSPSDDLFCPIQWARPLGQRYGSGNGEIACPWEVLLAGADRPYILVRQDSPAILYLLHHTAIQKRAMHRSGGNTRSPAQHHRARSEGTKEQHQGQHQLDNEAPGIETDPKHNRLPWTDRASYNDADWERYCWEQLGARWVPMQAYVDLPYSASPLDADPTYSEFDHDFYSRSSSSTADAVDPYQQGNDHEYGVDHDADDDDDDDADDDDDDEDDGGGDDKEEDANNPSNNPDSSMSFGNDDGGPTGRPEDSDGHDFVESMEYGPYPEAYDSVHNNTETSWHGSGPGICVDFARFYRKRRRVWASAMLQHRRQQLKHQDRSDADQDSDDPSEIIFATFEHLSNFYYYCYPRKKAERLLAAAVRCQREAEMDAISAEKRRIDKELAADVAYADLEIEFDGAETKLGQARHATRSWGIALAKGVRGMLSQVGLMAPEKPLLPTSQRDQDQERKSPPRVRFQTPTTTQGSQPENSNDDNHLKENRSGTQEHLNVVQHSLTRTGNWYRMTLEEYDTWQYLSRTVQLDASLLRALEQSALIRGETLVGILKDGLATPKDAARLSAAMRRASEPLLALADAQQTLVESLSQILDAIPAVAKHQQSPVNDVPGSCMTANDMFSYWDQLRDLLADYREAHAACFRPEISRGLGRKHRSASSSSTESDSAAS